MTTLTLVHVKEKPAVKRHPVNNSHVLHHARCVTAALAELNERGIAIMSVSTSAIKIRPDIVIAKPDALLMSEGAMFRWMVQYKNGQPKHIAIWQSCVYGCRVLWMRERHT